MKKRAIETEVQTLFTLSLPHSFGYLITELNGKVAKAHSLHAYKCHRVNLTLTLPWVKMHVAGKIICIHFNLCA